MTQSNVRGEQIAPGSPGASEAILEVRNLTVAFPTARGLAIAVNDVSLSIHPGKTLGIVGESGSGKSMTCRAIIGLVAWPGSILGGSVRWRGIELVGATSRVLREIRGKEISMIFQDPTSALNPVFPVGEQIAESLRIHLKLPRREARRESVALLARVGIPSPAERYRAYPHQLSGGMRQRAMIATAIACRPNLILADEPTTNLDVTIQDQILNLLAELQAEYGMAMILVSHDLGVVAQNAGFVVVMYAGSIVEEAPTGVLFEACRHPYTAGLIAALPTIRREAVGALESIPGQPPELETLPDGCPFRPRCRFASEACAAVDMRLIGRAGHRSACPFVDHLDLRRG
jgi:oligopeptide/dipeptide ABC transporter ATP-binding protein